MCKFLHGEVEGTKVSGMVFPPAADGKEVLSQYLPWDHRSNRLVINKMQSRPLSLNL